MCVCVCVCCWLLCFLHPTSNSTRQLECGEQTGGKDIFEAEMSWARCANGLWLKGPFKITALSELASLPGLIPLVDLEGNGARTLINTERKDPQNDLLYPYQHITGSPFSFQAPKYKVFCNHLFMIAVIITFFLAGTQSRNARHSEVVLWVDR